MCGNVLESGGNVLERGEMRGNILECVETFVVGMLWNRSCKNCYRKVMGSFVTR